MDDAFQMKSNWKNNNDIDINNTTVLKKGGKQDEWNCHSEKGEMLNNRNC